MRRLVPILWLLLAAPLCAQTVDLSKCPDCKILVPVSVSTELGVQFRSNIQMLPAAFSKLTAQDISLAREKAAADWVKVVKDASSAPKVEPTKEELELRKAELLKQIEAVDAEIAAKEEKP